MSGSFIKNVLCKSVKVHNSASTYFVAVENVLFEFKNLRINVIKKVLRDFLLGIKKMHGFFNINIWDHWKCTVFLVSFGICISVQFSFMQQGNYNFFGAVWNQTYSKRCLLELFKRRSKVHPQNISRAHLKLWPTKIIF